MRLNEGTSYRRVVAKRMAERQETMAEFPGLDMEIGILCMGIPLLCLCYGGNFDVGVQWQVMNGDADPGGKIAAEIPAVYGIRSGVVSHRFEIDSDVDEVVMGKPESL